MSTPMHTDDPEIALRGFLATWRRAVESGRPVRLEPCYAAEAMAFEAVSQVQRHGRHDCARYWTEMAAGCAGPVSFEVHQPRLRLGGELAFVHCLGRLAGAAAVEPVSWVRVTLCCRRVESGWEIVHEHVSVPVDMQAGDPFVGRARDGAQRRPRDGTARAADCDEPA